ncbi:MAG TPA: hypothetical protein VN771_01895 [Candidatus Baltobacteraceae bacterium]|nr:hypothetical protein [Candidatus Baltobacteraceae bacterium]
MGILDDARAAAERAAEHARETANQAAVVAAHMATVTGAATTATVSALGDDEHQARMREISAQGVKSMRTGLAAALDHFDPSILAGIIVRAMALQEATNESLHGKRSPYRISGLTITAGLPPTVSFAITRLPLDEELDEDASEAAASPPGGTVPGG